MHCRQIWAQHWIVGRLGVGRGTCGLKGRRLWWVAMWVFGAHAQIYSIMNACRNAFHNYSLGTPDAFMPDYSSVTVYCNLALIATV